MAARQARVEREARGEVLSSPPTSEATAPRGRRPRRRHAGWQARAPPSTCLSFPHGSDRGKGHSHPGPTPTCLAVPSSHCPRPPHPNHSRSRSKMPLELQRPSFGAVLCAGHPDRGFTSSMQIPTRPHRYRACPHRTRAAWQAVEPGVRPTPRARPQRCTPSRGHDVFAWHSVGAALSTPSYRQGNQGSDVQHLRPIPSNTPLWSLASPSIHAGGRPTIMDKMGATQEAGRAERWGQTGP